jgi:NAD(P)-dependent dehydrogenase (short-subunit alcohol dehydrogenase family)
MHVLPSQASKAAMVTFFETLSIEVGPEIKITIVTPGFIESEMTQGKFLVKEGKMEVDQDLRDVSSSPIASVFSVYASARVPIYTCIHNKSGSSKHDSSCDSTRVRGGDSEQCLPGREILDTSSVVQGHLFLEGVLP